MVIQAVAACQKRRTMYSEANSLTTVADALMPFLPLIDPRDAGHSRMIESIGYKRPCLLASQLVRVATYRRFPTRSMLNKQVVMLLLDIKSAGQHLTSFELARPSLQHTPSGILSFVDRQQESESGQGD